MVGDYRDLQQHAISYVQNSKRGILNAAKEINPKITKEDLEDLVSTGYVIALEIVASGKVDALENLFWSRLKRSVWDAYEYIFAFEHVEDGKGSSSICNAEEPFERVCREKEFINTTSSILDFLSTSEKFVLCLVLGLTSKGCCGVTEAAAIMGISRLAARTLYDRILRKVKDAVRQEVPAGWTQFSRGKPRPVPEVSEAIRQSATPVEVAGKRPPEQNTKSGNSVPLACRQSQPALIEPVLGHQSLVHHLEIPGMVCQPRPTNRDSTCREAIHRCSGSHFNREGQGRQSSVGGRRTLVSPSGRARLQLPAASMKMGSGVTCQTVQRTHEDRGDHALYC
jgi:hypothetical protein